MSALSKNSTTEKQYCNICSRSEIKHVVSSGLAPVSGGLCEECFSKGAENLGVIHLWLFHLGGLENAPELARQLVSFQNGVYVGWDQISEAYKSNAKAIEKSFEEEFLAVERGEFVLEDDSFEGETLNDRDD